MKRYRHFDDQLTILHLLILYDSPIDLIKYVLFIQRKLIKEKTRQGQELLLHHSVAQASCNGDLSVVKHLLDMYPDAVLESSNSRGIYGRNMTPLHVAIHNAASPELVRLLAGQGATWIRCGNGKTPYDMLRTHPLLYEKSMESVRLEVCDIIRPPEVTACCNVPLWSSVVWCVVLAIHVALGLRPADYALIEAYIALIVGYIGVRICKYKCDHLEWTSTMDGLDSDEIHCSSADNDMTTSQCTVGSSIGTSNESFGKCAVCWNHVADHAILPCGHLCLCAECSGRLNELNYECPIGKSCGGTCAIKIYDATIHTRE